MIKLKRSLLVLLLFVLIICTVSGCGTEERRVFETMEDFQDSKLGILLGASFDIQAKEFFPNAERVYGINITDLVLSLEQGKIDGILLDEAFYAPMKWTNQKVTSLEMDIADTKYGIAFPDSDNSDALKAQINEFIKSSKESGLYDELCDKWFSDSEPVDAVNTTELTGENGTLRVATNAELRPFCYMKNGQSAGFDIDFLTAFAKEYGYDLDFDVIDFNAILPGLVDERYDLAVASITITEERSKTVNFSDPYHTSPCCMVIYSENGHNRTLKLEDFEEASIGILTGSTSDKTASEKFPKANKVYYNSISDMVLAVEQEKIDCYISDLAFFVPVLWNNKNVERVDGVLDHVENALIFSDTPDGQRLREQMNEFIAQSFADGTIDALNDKWINDKEPTEHPDYESLSGENGTIHLAVWTEAKPFVYLRNGKFTGMEMDLLTLFGEKYGYNFKIEDVNFSSIILGVSEGRYDIGASGLTITPEREETISFSDSYIQYDVVLVTKANKTSSNTNQKLPDASEKFNVGVLTGSIYETLIKERFPNAEISYFTAHSDIIIALEQGKIDCFIEDYSLYSTMLWQDINVQTVGEVLATTEAAAVFPKDKADNVYFEQFNSFVQKIKENGTLDRLKDKWLAGEEPTEHPDYTKLSGENGVLRVAISSTVRPMTYMREEMFTGLEVELITMFAEEYGYSLQFDNLTFHGIIPAVMGGRCDLGMAGLSITEERAESVSFSDSYFTMEGVYIVSSLQEDDEVSFFDEVIEGFKKTFIREDRWKLILQGVAVTLIISLSALVFGSLVGFGLYMLSRSDVKFIRVITSGVAKVYSRIVAGTPVVVILMILFYVVFGKIRNMSGIFVAVIGFTLTFGAFVYDHMTVSVNSVDRGQTEAAYSLGYSKNRTFFRIILPQAMTIFMPSYCGHSVELIKATAVVGYIAVNDLTKVGDIIRSNTYEAFFPLLATALIYFILTWILSLVLGVVRRRFDPAHRKDIAILKGVKTE